MKIDDLTPTMKKIIDGMELVHTRLIQYKIKMNSELVVMQNGKVVRIKPEELLLKNEQQ
jgi:hypothetical protein